MRCAATVLDMPKETENSSNCLGLQRASAFAERWVAGGALHWRFLLRQNAAVSVSEIGVFGVSALSGRLRVF